LGAGEWSVTQVIAEQGFQYSSGHYETEVVTGENNLYDELGNITGSEQVLYNKENYIEDYSKPTINLSVTDSLTANSSMQRTTYHNSQNFPQNVESGATVSRQMAAGGANSLTFRQLRTGTALLKGWAVTA
jgi:hypothetical protein